MLTTFLVVTNLIPNFDGKCGNRTKVVPYRQFATNAIWFRMQKLLDNLNSEYAISNIYSLTKNKVWVAHRILRKFKSSLVNQEQGSLNVLIGNSSRGSRWTCITIRTAPESEILGP